MERWCPACGKAFQTERETCPDCLANLVDHLEAELVCAHCGHPCRATMETCPACLTLLHEDATNERVDEGIVRLLASGTRLIRPAKLPLFRDGPSCALTRFTPEGGMILSGRDALVEAYIDSPSNRAVSPMFCRDVTGDKLFRLAPYEASPRSLVAFDEHDAPLAIYQRHENPLERSLLVRDETSAPAARLQPSASARFDYELVETGGPVIAGVMARDEVSQDWVDDTWSLHQVGSQLPFKLFGAIGILLAAKTFFGRVEPESLKNHSRDKNDDGDGAIWSHLT